MFPIFILKNPKKRQLQNRGQTNAETIFVPGTSIKTYRKGNFSTNTTDKDFVKTFHDVSYGLSEILKKVKISTESEDVPSVDLTLSNNDPNANYVTKYRNNFGRCFSIELSPNITNFAITKIEFWAFMNIYIYLHHPGQFMDVDSKSKVSRYYNCFINFDQCYKAIINASTDSHNIIDCI